MAGSSGVRGTSAAAGSGAGGVRWRTAAAATATTSAPSASVAATASSGGRSGVSGIPRRSASSEAMPLFTACAATDGQIEPVRKASQP